MDKTLNLQHKKLTVERWSQMPLCEQMANIGSEVNRALNWQKRGKDELCQKAIFRALELFDLSLDSSKSFPRIKEFARLREAIVDYFYGANAFFSSEKLWRKYFASFNYAARKNY